MESVGGLAGRWRWGSGAGTRLAERGTIRPNHKVDPAAARLAPLSAAIKGTPRPWPSVHPATAGASSGATCADMW